jgi:hypothetical protein
MMKLVAALMSAGLLSASLGTVHAAVTAEEAKKLGTTLTIVGAEKAGNKEGTIPEYTGGLTTPPANFVKGSPVRPDPFSNEKPVYSINAKNMDKYADKLTEGAKALMKSYADFRIDVYPTHRTVAYPKWILDNTVKNATRGTVSADGLSIQGARAGTPFPIPKNGNEVMLNFLARWQGMTIVTPKYSAFNVDAAGKLVLSTRGSFMTDSPYYDEAKADNTILSRSRADYSGPARRAGEAISTTEPLNYAERGRRAYQYLPGQRRVRLAPDLAYDTPNPSTSGMSTIDDVSMFNGKMDRYEWTLLGKKELYVPYNAYRFAFNDKPEQVFTPKFINPDVVRWELHRVWVVEGKLKEGQRHIYSKRTFYIDEDSWYILASDQYDGRGQLWRPGFTYLTPAYDSLVPTGCVGHYDLIGGTYYINVWPGAGGVKFSDSTQPESTWSPDSLAASGVR